MLMSLASKKIIIELDNIAHATFSIDTLFRLVRLRIPDFLKTIYLCTFYHSIGNSFLIDRSMLFS